MRKYKSELKYKPELKYKSELKYNMELLKPFIIGSSAPVFFPFLYRVSTIPECDSGSMVGCKNYSDKSYSLLLPVVTGLISVSAAMIRRQYSISLFYSFMIVELIVVIIVMFLVAKFHLYNFTSDKDWYAYILRLGAFHFMEGVIAYYITKNIT